MLRILLIAKRPMLERITVEESQRRGQALAGLQQSAQTHAESLDRVRGDLAGTDLLERSIDAVLATDADDRDLIVTVGGDGTTLATSVLSATRPVISVNSDPSRSVGHFTRCTATGFAALLAAFRAGTHRIQDQHRLEVSVDGAPAQRFLNDCLFTSRHPALTTRYVLHADGRHETQMSSGVWVSTAVGSTGAIRSAGMRPVPQDGAALLFKVREPFQGRGSVRILEGSQVPPRGLSLTATMPGIDCYLDGAYRRIELGYGSTAVFAPAAEPLPLVTLPAA